MIWTIPREWPGETAFILAGGPSVKNHDLSLLRGRKVIVINSSYTAFPEAQYLFFGDSRWGKEHYPFPGFTGQAVTGGAWQARGVHNVIHGCFSKGLAERPDTLCFGKTSLQGAMGLAVHLGAARIVLLGADMRQDQLTGATHHHAPHKWAQPAGCWGKQMEHLVMIVKPLKERGIEVVNCSLASLLPWWPKAAFEDVIG